MSTTTVVYKRLRAELDAETDPKTEPLNAQGEGIVEAGGNFIIAGTGLFFQTFSFGAAIGSAVSTLIGLLPLLIALSVMAGLSSIWIDKHDVLGEEFIYGLSNIIYPIYRDFVKDFVELLLFVFSYLVCWYDIAVGYFFLIYREVIYPIAFEGGLQEVITRLLTFLRVTLFNVVEFAARFLSSAGANSGNQVGIRLDFSEITPAFQATWASWQDLVCFACGTLCKVLRTLPIFPTILLVMLPIPNVLPVLPFIAGDQIGDTQTWRAIDNAINAALELGQIFLRLIWDLLLLPVTGTVNRPNLRPFGDLLCEAVQGVVRSVENSLQRFWDCFPLFPFNFIEWLCVVDTAVCAALKIVLFALDIIIHIDQIINYPIDPYWGTVSKADFIEIVNLIGEPANTVSIFNKDTGLMEPQEFTNIPVIRGENGPNPEVLFTIDSYYTDPFAEITPQGLPSRTQGRRRVAECIGIFIQRALCDPRVNETVCFQVDNDGLGAAILQDFDLAKVANALGTLVVDVLSLGFELTLHIDFANEPDAFFLFTDRSPFDEIIKEDGIRLLGAILDIFTIIPPPELGRCLRDLVLELVRLWWCLLLFAGQYILGLSTLPYFLIDADTRTIKDTPNFVTRTDESLNFITSIFNRLIDRNNPGSLISCLSTLVNNGFPVPPIPCANCTVIGLQDASILEPNPTPKAKMTMERLFPYGRLMAQHPEDKLFDPYAMLSDVFGYRKRWDINDRDTAGLRMTPLRYYKAPKELQKGYNPFMIAQMIWSNYDTLTHQFNGNLKGFLNAGETRRFIQERKNEVLDHYRERGTCASLRNKKWNMEHTKDKEQRQEYLRERRKGTYMPLEDGTCPDPKTTLKDTTKDRGARFTLFPTEPALASCGNQTLGIPAPPCFDLACVVRTSLELVVHALNLVARFFNGLIQGEDPNQKLPGEGNYGYFTGEFCSRSNMDDLKPCFESDIIILVRSIVLPLKCLCEFINLVIPVVENAPRGDLCCSIQRVGELVACIVELLVNAINALAMGEDVNPLEAYAYYKKGEFQRDIARVFVVVEGVAECICVFIRGIFPGNFFEDFTETIDFDPCCFIEAYLDAIINLVQLILNIIISLATLASGSPESFCYWRVDADVCVGQADFGPGTIAPDGTISTIGFVQDVLMVIDALLPDSNTQCYANCNGADPGKGGVIPCACQIINALLPIRPDPSRPVSCGVDNSAMNFPTVFPTQSPTASPGPTQAPTSAPTRPPTNAPTNAPTLFTDAPTMSAPPTFSPTVAPPASDTNCVYIDFCCPLVKTGFALKAGGRFAVEAFASLWQSWDPGYPEFFTAYIFCDETQDVYGLPEGWGETMMHTTPGDSAPLLTPQNPAKGSFVCGKLNPVINALVGAEGLVNRCLCEYFQLLDWLLSQFFGLILGPSGLNQWGNCFCGRSNDPFGVNGGQGYSSECPPGSDLCTAENLFVEANQSNSILGAVSYLVEVILKAIVTLLRRLPDPLYWSPMGNDNNGILTTIEETWIYSFLGPIGDAACLALGNVICFINSLFFLNPDCTPDGKRFLGGTINWVFTVVIRVIAFIEGFVEQITGGTEPCDSAECGSHPSGGSVYGLKGDTLGAAIVAIFSIPIDVLIGDGSLSCSGICVPRVLKPEDEGGLGPCACYNRGIKFKPSKKYITETYPFLTETQIALENLENKWWRVDNASNPTMCVAYLDSAPNAEVAADTTICPTPTSCVAQPLCSLDYCVENFICRPAEMPTCGAHPGTPSNIVDESERFTPIDGILMGFLRYVRCVSGPVGIIFYPLEVIFTVVWQIAGAILNFLASILIFFFSLFQLFAAGNLIPIITAFANIFIAFIDIFRTPVNVAPLESRRRNTFAELKNMSHMSDPEGNIMSAISEFIYEYETDMCFSDLDVCICSNLDIEGLCTYDRDTGVHPPSLSDMQILQYLSKSVFTGRSTCDMDVDHLVQSYGASVTWANVPFMEKKLLIDCVDKRIRGDRLHHLLPAFPADYFYNHKGPLQLFSNLRAGLQETLKQDARYQDDVADHEAEKRHFQARFPRFRERLETRAKQATDHMLFKTRMSPTSPVLDSIVQLDQIWYKYRRGYYGYMLDRALPKLKQARFGVPPLKDAAYNVMMSLRHFARVTYHQPYREVVSGIQRSREVGGELFQRVMERGPRQMFHEWRSRGVHSEMQRRMQENRARFADLMERTPLVRFWRYGNAKRQRDDKTPFQRYWDAMPIVGHMKRVWDFQERHKRENPKAFFQQGWWTFSPAQTYRRFKGALSKRFTAPEWTPEQLHMWRSLESFTWQTQERVYPGSTPKHKRDFLLTQSCRIVDDTIMLTTRLFNYCAAGYAINRPGAPELCVGGNCTSTRMEPTIRAAADRYAKKYHTTIEPSRMRRWKEQGIEPKVRPASDYVWEPMPSFINADGSWAKGAHLYRRLRSDTRQHQAHKNRHWTPNKVDRRVYRRTVTFSSGAGNGPTGFNLYQTVKTFLADLFEVDLDQGIDEIIIKVKAWVTNPNVDVEDFPDVGLLYYLTFAFNCRYFENLDCGIGIGLEDTLRIILKYYLIVLVVGGILAPGLLAPILPVGSFVLFVVVVPAMAWHYSPQCWFMTPTIPVASIQLPIFPFPVAFPALPFCIGEELKYLLNKYIAPCYAFLIPRHWINGVACPPIGQRIDIVNCRADVGVSDGIQNVLWLGYTYLGSWFVDVVQGVGMILPFTQDYIDEAFILYRDASTTEMLRQRDCSVVTLTSLALPILIALPTFILGGAVVVGGIAWLGSLFGLLRASPLSAIFTPAQSPWMTLPQDAGRADRPLVETLGNLIESLFIRRKKKKRKAHRD